VEKDTSANKLKFPCVGSIVLSLLGAAEGNAEQNCAHLFSGGAGAAKGPLRPQRGDGLLNRRTQGFARAAWRNADRSSGGDLDSTPGPAGGPARESSLFKRHSVLVRRPASETFQRPFALRQRWVRVVEGAVQRMWCRVAEVLPVQLSERSDQ